MSLSRFFVVMVAGFMMAVSAMTPLANAEDQCPSIEKVIKDIENFSKKKVNVEKVGPSPFPGICEIQFRFGGRLQIIYTDTEGKYIMLGHLIDTASGKNLTRETIESLMTLSAEELEKVKSLVAFTVGESGKDVYFATDPQCPYCVKGEAVLKKMADAGEIKLNYLLYPLPFHKGAKEQCIAVYCDKKGPEGLHNKYTSDNQCEEGKKKVEDTIAFLKGKSISGTPAYIFPDGPYRMGVLQEPQVRQALKLPPAKKPAVKKEMPVMKKEQPEAKKEQPEAKKEQPDAKAEKPEAQKAQPEVKKEEPQAAQKDQPEAKKEEPEVKKEEAEKKEAEKKEEQPKEQEKPASKE